MSIDERPRTDWVGAPLGLAALATAPRRPAATSSDGGATLEGMSVAPTPPSPPSPGEWDAACPFCGAASGQPCRTASGRMAARIHADRPTRPAGAELVAASSTEIALAAAPAPPDVVAEPDTTGLEPVRDEQLAGEPDPQLPQVRLVEVPSSLRADLRELRVDPLRLAGLLATVIALFVSSRVLLG